MPAISQPEAAKLLNVSDSSVKRAVERAATVPDSAPQYDLRVGWELPDDMSEADWRAAGSLLGKVERSVSWWIGDWWRAHKPEWGNRAIAAASEEWAASGLPDYTTCRHAGATCDAFDIGRRRPNLSFTHHAEVAWLSPDEADALLDWAELGERRGRPAKEKVQNLAQNPAGQKTRRIAAGKAGFGNETTYRQAKSVVDNGVPDLVAAMAAAGDA